MATKGTKPGATHVTGPGGLSAGGFAKWYRERSQAAWASLSDAAVEKLAHEVERCERERRSIWVLGNGGSASTASHLATDLAKTSHVEGRPRIKAVSLSDNMAYVTATANDRSFDEVFSLQLDGLVEKGDLVIIVSGSGNSPNVLEAAKAAKKKGAVVAALLGFDGGKLKALADVPVHVDSDQYGIVEDLHMSVGHMVAFWLKQRGR